jgi:hypothetical protein
MWQNLNHLIKNNSYGCKNPKVEFKKKKKKKNNSGGTYSI